MGRGVRGIFGMLAGAEGMLGGAGGVVEGGILEF